MKLSNGFMGLAALLLITGCTRTQAPPLVQRTVKSIQLDSLVAEDLSENMSRLSTQEDEVTVLAYIWQRQQIRAFQQAPLLTFTATQPTQLLGLRFNELLPEDRISIFLIELDEEQPSDDWQALCAAAILKPGFPQHFEHAQLDSLLGDDDLLAVHTQLVLTTSAQQKITLRGRQLFDPFVYHLYLNAE